MNNKIRLYQASVQSRVFHKVEGPMKRRRYLRGRQGNWYHERRIVIASDEGDAEERLRKDIASRRVIGKPKHKLDGLDREVEILKIEEIA